MKLNEIEKLKQTDKFYEWWDAVGSAIRRYEGQDMQEHSLRVARMAWQDRGLLIDNMSDKYLFNRQHTRYD
jgi:hypothetical protein